MNTLDYLDWRGDLSFSMAPFNEVDNLIFSHLAYVNMDNLVTDQPIFSLTIAELAKAYENSGHDQSNCINDPRALLMKAGETLRFGCVQVGMYRNIICTEEQIQFSAVSFLLDDGTIYVAYRGTDATVVGWREDCNFIFMEESAGQMESVRYLTELAWQTTAPLRVGGHSKGGNFAVFASAFCDPAISQERILKIYSNDGPGFNQHRLNSPEYLAIVNKIEKIIPEGSMIGILLASQEKMRMIDSDAKGIMQHNPYTWCVMRDHFVLSTHRTFGSVFTDLVLKQWVDVMDIEQRVNLVNLVFDSIEKAGYSTFSELFDNPGVAYNAIVKAVSEVNPAIRNDVIGSLIKLAGLSKNTLWNEAKKTFEKIDDKLPMKEKRDDYKEKLDSYKKEIDEKLDKTFDKIDKTIDKIDDMLPFIKLRDEEKRAEKKLKEEKQEEIPGVLMSNPTEILTEEETIQTN